MNLAIETAPSIRRNPGRAAIQLLSCVRLGEALLLQGSPLIGALFSIGRITSAECTKIALLAAGSTALVAHVFVLNDWSGASCDLRDPNRVNGVFTNKGVGRKGIAYLSLALLTVALLLLRTLGNTVFAIGAAIAVLSALYSIPRIHAKGVPVLSSVLHFAGGLLHFLLGYSVFSAPDSGSIQIGSFFALVFVAGHLTQETRDSESDRSNGIRTNAVAFGKMQGFLGGLALFTIADILLVVLALDGVVPRLLAICAIIYPLHIHWSLQAIRAGLTFQAIQRLRARYRTLYALTGLFIVATVLLSR